MALAARDEETEHEYIKLAQLMSIGCSSDSAAYLLEIFEGNINKCLLYHQNVQKFVIPVDSNIKLLGFENGGNSCYVDSLIFGMFGRVDAFDWLLLKDEDEEEEEEVSHGRKAIVAVQDNLRVLVNIMRSGLYVSSDFVNIFRVSCMRAGWRADSVTSQEDVSEFFLFLLDILSFPSLPLEERFFHGAKMSISDVKFSAEKMLVLSLFESTKAVPSVNDLLSSYFFDNPVHDLRRKAEDGEKSDYFKDEKKVDAWKSLSLLPFYTTDNKSMSNLSDRNNKQMKIILPILLKRFDMLADGQIIYCSKSVLVPSQLDFNKYLAESGVGNGKTFSLHLKSVICRFGETVDVGHYIAYTNQQPSNPSQSAVWLKLDDLKPNPSVSEISELEKISLAFYEEVGHSSYLLFYELIYSDKNVSSDLILAEQLQAEELEAEDKERRYEERQRRASGANVGGGSNESEMYVPHGFCSVQ